MSLHKTLSTVGSAYSTNTASPYAWFAAIPNIQNSQAIMKGEATPQTLGVKALDDKTFK